jgi:soluble lytic murein transglycosylase-like protein
MLHILAAGLGALVLAQSAAAQDSGRARLDALIAKHAQANGVPVALVHRVVKRESGYRPDVVGRRGAMGLMQIKVATARGLGYSGSARGLLDPDTNLTYAVRYLAGAYRVAGGNHDRAVMHYARGYYFAAKRKRMLEVLTPMPAPARIAAPSGDPTAPAAATEATAATNSGAAEQSDHALRAAAIRDPLIRPEVY